MRSVALPAAIAGALLMACNSLVAAMDGVIVRLVSADVHPIGIVFFRNLFSLLVLWVLVAHHRLAAGGSAYWHVHALRAIVKLLALLAAFIAVTRIPLSTARGKAVALTVKSHVRRRGFCLAWLGLLLPGKVLDERLQ